ncbi:ABC transporter ATP-binding protein [Clostridium zeae]|uniref:ABC transporter ATP-binding protein n=1 Tax=Clostridium zeae TaxID=2759022 RepID=A0ABQ1EAC9_9CLOT|nr:ABC transporter ATP-binding protein [Clostridium zeae]GFZ31735.1 ABC transporter ATP-binding protein [Clostridium zeae]
MDIIRFENICKVYGEGENTLYALNDTNITIKEGEMVSIMGPSGSGKSTLLNIMGFIDQPTSGKYFLNNIEFSELQKKKLHKIRNMEIGFIFQYFALLKEYSALDNVILPLSYRKLSTKACKEKALECMDKIGIKQLKDKLPAQLSGGQQQRVAIARALVGDPKIILADEPTGALDVKTGKEIMNILKLLNNQGKTIIIVTHDPNIANMCDRIISLKDGQII